MDTRTLLLQLARSLFARRKKWIVLTTLASFTLLVPAAYLLSKEPPRYQTIATVLIENKADRAPLFQRRQVPRVRGHGRGTPGPGVPAPHGGGVGISMLMALPAASVFVVANSINTVE